MSPAEARAYARMYTALARIRAYSSPDHLRRTARKDYGLDPDEAIEMAYENVIGEAKAGLRGVRQRVAIESRKGNGHERKAQRNERLPAAGGGGGNQETARPAAEGSERDGADGRKRGSADAFRNRRRKRVDR